MNDFRTNRRPASRAGAIAVALTAAAVAGAVFSGCAKPDAIDGTYGRRRGEPGGASVNGTAVLAEMFQQAGHRVSTWRRLSPSLDKCDVIVWVPDDFEPPTKEQCRYLEKWLAGRPGRTLIYIGRDYDARITYWEKMQSGAPAAKAAEVARRLAEARAEHASARSAMPAEKDCPWFTMRSGTVRHKIRGMNPPKLSGPWSRDIRASKVDIEWQGRLDIPQEPNASEETDATQAPEAPEQPEYPWQGDMPEEPEYPWQAEVRRAIPQYDMLLGASRKETTGGDSSAVVVDPLLTRITEDDWGSSQILIVVNGSFLLNLPLVNREHRKLAAKLIDACGDRPSRVVFLESGPGGPSIRNNESGGRTGLEALLVWPMNFILLHVMVLGLVYCFWRFPIFGRPRRLVSETTSDFGRHIEALGKLLEQTGQSDYARGRIAQYRQLVVGDARAEHSPTPVAAPKERVPEETIAK